MGAAEDGGLSLVVNIHGTAGTRIPITGIEFRPEPGEGERGTGMRRASLRRSGDWQDIARRIFHQGT